MPALTSITPVLDGVQLTVTGESNATYVIEASTNLQTWFPVATNTEASANRLISVPNFGPRSYYRASGLHLRFSAALATKDTIDLNGNNVIFDSFDSENPAFSTDGKYDAAKRKDGGDLATQSGSTNGILIDVGNAKVYGRVYTGTNGTIAIAINNGRVGSIAWHDAGNLGIEPGWVAERGGTEYPNPIAPSGPYFTPSSGTIDGVFREYVLLTGTYQLSNLVMTAGSLFVDGDAILYVTGNCSLSATASIIINTGARLQFYAGGSSVNLGGGSVQNSNGPSAFVYYGLLRNTSFSLGNASTFFGCIYAPGAIMTLNGGGTATFHFVGAIVSRSATLNGHVQFHYDEALSRQ